MSLPLLAAEAFAPDGVLSRVTLGFKARAGQTEMALAVSQAIEQGSVLVVEAGTGVGKTFSYLVPALLSGKKVLVSTATKALQDQLFGRDLPGLVQALELPLVCRVLKGRGSYLCLQRLPLARHSAGVIGYAEMAVLARIEQWATQTQSGEIAEIPGMDERSALIPLVTSTRENCLGSQCPQFKACHVNKARREALLADVLVINHHLFFADMAVRESGMAELLPAFDIAIFDEAHQMNETGIQFLGQHLATGQLLDFSRDLLASGLQHARGLHDWPALAQGVEIAARNLRLVASKVPLGSKLRWRGPVPEGLASPAWSLALEAVHTAGHSAQKALEMVRETAPDFDRLIARAETFCSRARGFSAVAAPESVRWLDVTSQLRLVESPLDVALAMQALVYPQEGRATPQKTWVFTSATLAADAQLRGFTEPMGLQQAQVLQVGSPFDFAQQAALYVPKGWPLPGDPAHSEQVARFVASAASCLQGRTLVLTTSLKAMRTVGEHLQVHFEATGEPIDVLVQGQWPKRELMRRFSQGASVGHRACVLVGSASFWEGVDIPGAALQLVVIDKLPFPPPRDPLVEARANRLEATGRNPFQHYFLPETAVALKQGAGRLIRRESDVGILVVCDSRLLSMGYGRQLLNALPPMRRLGSEADFQSALDALTKTSTTDLTELCHLR
ncbi:MAG: ATP-dependent DNA helicase [Burkholderiales bacterium]